MLARLPIQVKLGTPASMADLNFVKKHSVGADEAASRIRVLLDKFAGDYPKLKIKISWSGDRAGKCSGRGFDGKFSVAEDSVRIDIKIGLLARPFADRVEAGMTRKLNEAFDG
ncbi:MAG: putative polyhydroxyalkanoate system protein [Myxococcota bacterium]|jgi:putative polyhydroxyalkanoate system protein